MMLSGTIKYAPDDDLYRIENCGRNCHVLIHEGEEKANSGWYSNKDYED